MGDERMINQQTIGKVVTIMEMFKLRTNEVQDIIGKLELGEVEKFNELVTDANIKSRVLDNFMSASDKALDDYSLSLGAVIKFCNSINKKYRGI